VTLKTLYTYLRLLENAADMKRKMPASSPQRSLKEGLSEMSKLAGIENGEFKDPQNLACMIGAQRFVMIWGEPSLTAHVARSFDSSRLLLTVLIDPRYFDKGVGPQSGAPSASLSQFVTRPTDPDQESALENLKSFLSGNVSLTCRLFRVLFEHMLGFASPATAQQGSAVLVNDLAGSKEHGRSFMATAMFVLGAEIDRENVMPFMLEQNLFGMQLFEQLLLNRDYCDAFYTFRRLERAFIASSAEEESQLKLRFDKFNAQFGGKPCGTKMFEADDQHKARVDSHLAAADLLEVMALTPWGMSLGNSIAAGTSNSLRSLKTIARHFELLAEGKESKEQSNREIADHLLAFARQFSADPKTAPVA
jgi:hypothetical protein